MPFTSKSVLIGVLVVWVVAFLGFQTWRRSEVIRYDVSSYYSYLPAAFIYHDLGFGFLKKEDRLTLWYQVAPDGRRFQRMTMGVACLYAPFFGVAHLFTCLTHSPRDGYGVPYAFAIAFGGLCYAFCGLLFLRKVLRHYFEDRVVAFTLFAVALGTNLLYYVVLAGAMSHAHSFFLFAALLHFVLRWKEFPSVARAIIPGILFGLIVLIRPTNALMALPAGLFLLANQPLLLEFLRKAIPSLLIALVAAFVVVFPQMLFWKSATGHWIFYSYEGEHFYFSHPHIWKGLFSYRKGWLLYTPMAMIGILGMGKLKTFAQAWVLAVPVYFVLQIYVCFSWWSWWYGGGFGQRPMVETYALLALPMAAAFASISQERKSIQKALLMAFFAGAVFLNGFQTLQMRLGVLHWNSMTRSAYWATFLRLKQPDNMHQLIQKPVLNKALMGEDEPAYE